MSCTGGRATVHTRHAVSAERRRGRGGSPLGLSLWAHGQYRKDRRHRRNEQRHRPWYETPPPRNRNTRCAPFASQRAPTGRARAAEMPNPAPKPGRERIALSLLCSARPTCSPRAGSGHLIPGRGARCCSVRTRRGTHGSRTGAIRCWPLRGRRRRSPRSHWRRPRRTSAGRVRARQGRAETPAACRGCWPPCTRWRTQVTA